MAMNAKSSLAVVGLVVAMAVATIIATGHEPEPAPVMSTPTGPDPRELATLKPISSPGQFATGPTQVQSEISLSEVADLCGGGESRVAGETCALEFAHLIVETGQSLDADKVVDDLVESPSAALEEFLRTVPALEYANGWQRHWLTDRESWIRSEVAGAAETPDSIRVEIAYHQSLQLYPNEIQFSLLGVNVEWAEDGWKVTDFTAGFVGPIASIGPDDVLGNALEGEGWRQIPASTA